MRHIPLLAEEGWLRHQENAAKPQKRRRRARSASAIARSRNGGQFGWPSKACRTDHPVRDKSEGIHSFDVADTPPLRGGECAASKLCPKKRSDLPGRAGRRIPTGLIVLLLKMTADDEWLSQIRRVLDYGLNDQPGFAVRLIGAIKIFGNHGLVAVGYTVPAEVSRFHFRGDDLDRSAHYRAALGAAPGRVLGAAAGTTTEARSTLSSRAADRFP